MKLVVGVILVLLLSQLAHAEPFEEQVELQSTFEAPKILSLVNFSFAVANTITLVDGKPNRLLGFVALVPASFTVFISAAHLSSGDEFSFNNTMFAVTGVLSLLTATASIYFADEPDAVAGAETETARMRPQLRASGKALAVVVSF